jgi:Ni,Fe-hydrogenase III large subunit/Ni,Fe-hydrogenase III component G
VNSLTLAIEQQLKKKGFVGRSRRGRGGEVYLTVSVVALVEITGILKSRSDVRLIGLWAAENFEGSGISLFYCFEQRGNNELLILDIRLIGNQGLSIAADFPVASYFQREIADGFGVVFEGAFDKRRLFLHDAYPDDFHPLRKSVKNEKIEPTAVTPRREYQFREFTGEGMYQIPVGPVHAGIIEPGHFRFSVIGETIFNLEIRHFWKHRGLEKLAEGRTPDAAVSLAEAVSGDESAANACAFAMAIEIISGATVPKRANALRVVMLELERIYSHLGGLAGMVTDVAYPMGAAPFFILREEILRWNAELIGSRFLKGIIVPGGMSKDINEDRLRDLVTYMGTFAKRLATALKTTHESSWAVDRMETTGAIKPELIAALNLTGPTARASGDGGDTRLDHPYGGYESIFLKAITAVEGDVYARFQVKAGEISESVRVIKESVKAAGDGPVRVDCVPRNGYAVALVESARGQNLHWVYVKDGVIDRWKVRTASFCNWPAIEHAVINNIVPDFPLINKSLNLSYAGNDL